MDYFGTQADIVKESRASRPGDSSPRLVSAEKTGIGKLPRRFGCGKAGRICGEAGELQTQGRIRAPQSEATNKSLGFSAETFGSNLSRPYYTRCVGAIGSKPSSPAMTPAPVVSLRVRECLSVGWRTTSYVPSGKSGNCRGVIFIGALDDASALFDEPVMKHEGCARVPRAGLTERTRGTSSWARTPRTISSSSRDDVERA